ncbi:hypothetical protein Tco_1028710 [Tanacetum coccineum]|uniref:Uncharacterized protein n=1 Tax=Tanacetum coccineum TaxID=301880 RepID=A0ABQ5G2Y5_9ASTR
MMAQQQHAADVHLDELCPPNKRYDLMDANKKVDLEHVQCPPESKILTNIIKNHPLRFSIAASSSVPWFYMGQFWHTLKEDGSKYRLKFMLDKKELTLILDDFRTIFHLPQATDNNHYSFVPPPSFSEMVPLYKQVLGFTMELKTSSSFKTTGLLQPWKTLCKIFSKCLTTRVTRWDQPQRNKNKVGMRIPAWMLTDEMKLTEHYKMYADVFGLDVPLTQSQPTESTQGMHRTPSSPRQSAPLTPPVLVPSTKKANEMILQDMLQIEKLVEDPENVDDSSPPMHDDTSIPGTRLEPRSDKESLEVEIVQEKKEETTKDTEVEPDKDTLMVDITNIVTPNVEETRISPIPSPTRSPRNLSTLVSSDTEKLWELTVTHPTPSLGKLYPLGEEESNKHVKKEVHAKTTKEETERLISKAILQKRGRMQAHISSQIQNEIDNAIPSRSMMQSVRSLYVVSYSSSGGWSRGRGWGGDTAQVQSSSVPEQQHQIYLAMKADPLLQQQDIAIWLALQMKFEKTEEENSSKRQKTSEYEAYVSRESSSGQANVEEPGPSTSVTQDIMEEISLTIDDAKLKKMADEMLRQRCTSRDEHQYHIDQMKNFLQSDIVWDSRKEILVSPHP